MRSQREADFYEPGRGSSPDTDSARVLNFSASRTVRNTFFYCLRPPRLWRFVTATHTDGDTGKSVHAQKGRPAARKRQRENLFGQLRETQGGPVCQGRPSEDGRAEGLWSACPRVYRPSARAQHCHEARSCAEGQRTGAAPVLSVFAAQQQRQGPRHLKTPRRKRARDEHRCNGPQVPEATACRAG